MKSIGYRFRFIGILLVASCVLTDTSAEATDTNFWISLSSGRWDTGANWSFSIPPSTNSQSYTDITNNFSPSQTSKIITIDSTTAVGTMSISNLLLSAPMANNGTQNVQGQNTLLVSNAASTVFRILNTLTMSTGGSISITNSTVRVDGTNAIVAAYIDGNIWVNTGTFMVTNKIMELGVTAQGSLTVSNGTTDIGALEIAENSGSAGTLTVAGGTNALDGYIVIGNSPGATGTVWMTGGSMRATGNVTRVGNAGPGQMIVSNGAWASQGLEVGSIAGANGTLTLVAGSVAAKGPLIIGGGTGTGTVVVGAFAEMAITNLPTAPFLGLGFFICDGSTLLTNGGTFLATNAFTFIGEHGSGSFTNSGGTAKFKSLDIGVLSGSSGTLTMLGGTTTVSQQTTVGDNTNATGSVWMLGGQYNGPMTVGSSGIGRVTMSNGTMNVNNLVLGLNGVGTLTMAGGTNSVFTSLVLGQADCSATGIANVVGGNLFVTNAAGNAVLDVESGTFTLSSGTVIVDTFVLNNTCAHFVRTGGTLIYNTAVLNSNADTDGDGIPNGYEQSHGFDPLNPADASADNDGDGFSNLQEYLAGTDPNDPNSTPFHVTSIIQQGSGHNILLTWTTVGGTTNQVQVTQGTGNGSYATNGFTNLSSQLLIGGSGLVTNNYIDTGGATNTFRYYRVRLVP